MIIFGPLALVLQHDLLQDLTKIGTREIHHPIQFPFDLLQGKQSFPEGEGQSWSDLENGDPVLYHLSKALPRLIIRGMSFKDQVGVPL